MSDWSVRQLIDEYRSDGQENSPPRSRSKADYTDALQGVLAAMLMDEPSPLSSQLSARPTRGIARTTEEALGALLDSNFRGDYTPSSATSSLPINSSSRPSSIDTGFLGSSKPFTTDDVLSYLVGDLESSGKSSVRAASNRSRFDPSAQSSATKGNPILAAANRLFDQSRYSLAADWKLNDAHSPLEGSSFDTSLRRRDSESGLDRADFALLPPALGHKPLTPLGEKDKVKASTPPEPVQTRTLIDRKKSKELVEIEPIAESEDIIQDEPHDDYVRPAAPKAARAKVGKKLSKGRVVKAKKPVVATKPPEPPALRKAKPEQAPTNTSVLTKSVERGEHDGGEVRADLASWTEELDPAASDLADLPPVEDETSVIDIATSGEAEVAETVPPEKSKKRNSSEAQPPPINPRMESAEIVVSDLKRGRKKATRKSDKPPAPKGRQADAPAAQATQISEAAVDSNAASTAIHLRVPPELDFDSQDSEGRHFGGALLKLQTIAARVVQKPASPAAWITPRPAGQTDSRFEAPPEAQINQPSVQVELSAEIPSLENALVDQQSAEEPSSIVLYTANHDEPFEMNDDPHMESAEPSPDPENSKPSAPTASPQSNEIEDLAHTEVKRKSIPKRSVGRNSGGRELMPATNSAAAMQIVPARRGQQTYGIQVSNVRAAVPKRKPVQINEMQPGKLRRISICDEKTDAAKEEGKIVRTASKRLRVPTLKWWAGERIEYKSEDGTLGRTVATAVYRKEDDTSTTLNPKGRLRRLKEPLALPAAPVSDHQSEVQTLSVISNDSDISRCKLHIKLSNATAQPGWNTIKPRAVPALGVNRKNVVIRRADVPNGWDLYKKNDMCFSANVLLQNACFASVLIRLPPSETNGVDMSRESHMLVEFVSGATLLVLMSRESASTVEHGEIVGDRKGVELSRAGSKVMIPPMYRYQFKNVSETEESLLITHVVTENKQSFFSK